MVRNLCRGACALLIAACSHGAEEAVPARSTSPAPPPRDAGGAVARTNVAARREGLADSEVVCATCAPDLLAAKRAGILRAMALVVAYAGADVLPEHAPITFHLDGDDVCGSASDASARDGYLTGFSFTDAQGKGQVCLFDVEKKNRALAFTPDNARTLADQVLPVHEAMHVWFSGREDDEATEEPFVKMTSFVVSGTIPDPCTGFRVTSAPDSLVGALCDAGFTIAELPTILRRTADAARDRGRAIDVDELAAIVSAVIGADARPAFRAAGLL